MFWKKDKNYLDEKINNEIINRIELENEFRKWRSELIEQSEEINCLNKIINLLLNESDYYINYYPYVSDDFFKGYDLILEGNARKIWKKRKK